ncbi:UxaA family hydrolase [Candidatus Bipolaricaulota bacterium]
MTTGEHRILGYRRPDGRIGIRNHVAIVYTTNCAEVVARSLHRRFPVGTQLFGYPEGCSYQDAPAAKIVAMAQHSSYAGVLVVGLGCEGADAADLAERIGASGQTVEAVTIQVEGGDLKTIEKGSRILADLLQHASVVPREPLPVSDLIVGSECGGSDATSGLVSNPLVGLVADRLIDEGGTYMHAEPHELMGCADVLAARAVDDGVAQDVRAAIEEAERESFESGVFHIGFGNIEGGLTTIEEKSYGCLAKSGSRPLQGVLRAYGPPPSKGYYLQIAPPGSTTYFGDSEDVSQFAACGAHLAFFTTGCGATTGGLLPVIKVMANPHRMELIRDNVDFDATPIARGERTLEEMTDELYEEMIAVAAGKLTRSEILRHFEA